MSKPERMALQARMQTLTATVEAIKTRRDFHPLPCAVWRRKGVPLQAH